MKKITFIFALASVMLCVGVADFAPAKEKRTDNLHEVTYSVSDCL